MTKTEKALFIGYITFLAAISVGTVILAILNWEAMQTDKSGIIGGFIAMGVGIPLVGIFAAFKDANHD